MQSETVINNKYHCLAVLWLACLINTGIANADVGLAPASHAGYRMPLETITITHIEDANLADQEYLAMELDDVDVSEMMVQQNNRLVYTPLQPLMPGSHTLRLVKYDQQQQLTEIASWTFEVRQSATFRQYSANADIQLSANNRVDEYHLDQPLPKRQQYQGSGQFGYSADAGNWHTQGQFDLIYNSSNDPEFGPRKLDNGSFLFSLGNQSSDLQIGHQAIGDGDMAMADFTRRGFSVGTGAERYNAHITGFMLSSEDVNGFGRGLAISDPQKRVGGVAFRISPLEDERLLIRGTLINGKKIDTLGYSGFIDDLENTISEGSAQSISLSSQLLDSRLEMNLEYAHSGYDANTTDTISSNSDNAYHARLAYSDTLDSGASWNSGLETQRVGVFFKSMANEGLQADDAMTQLFAGMQWETVGVQVNVQRQHDNVEHLVELPRVQTDLSSLTLNWNPAIEDTSHWYGTPAFDATLSQQTQKEVLSPDPTLPIETDTRVYDFQSNANFSYELASWGVSLSQNRQRDDTGLQDDTDTQSIGLNASLPLLHQQLTLAPTIQHDSSKDLLTGVTTDSVTYTLESNFNALENRLEGSLSLSMNNNQVSDNSVNSDTSSATVNITWHALQARPNHPGFDIALNAEYNDNRDKLFIENSMGNYQVVISVSMVLPGQLGIRQ